MYMLYPTNILSLFNNEFNEDSYNSLKEYGVDYFFSFKELESTKQDAIEAKKKLNLSVAYESENIIIYKL